LQQYLESDQFFNQQHPELEAWLKQVKGISEQEKAVSIYYLVRDGIRYDPFTLLEGAITLSSDFCLNRGVGYCITKAALQITLSRAVGIPARLGLADVKNHLSSPKLDDLLKNEIFTMHAYVEQYLNGQWVKSTSAFNKALCDKANIQPLEFNGIQDSIFQKYTSSGNKHMEYLKDHGCFSHMPQSFIQKNVALHYPHLALNFDTCLSV